MGGGDSVAELTIMLNVITIEEIKSEFRIFVGWYRRAFTNSSRRFELTQGRISMQGEEIIRRKNEKAYDKVRIPFVLPVSCHKHQQ